MQINKAWWCHLRLCSSDFGRFGKFRLQASQPDSGQISPIRLESKPSRRESKSSRRESSKVGSNPKQKTKTKNKKLRHDTDTQEAALVAAPRVGRRCGTLPAMLVLPRLFVLDVKEGCNVPNSQTFL